LYYSTLTKHRPEQGVGDNNKTFYWNLQSKIKA
jgi:hypothetical protein